MQQQVRAAASKAKLYIVTGPSGAGKTSLVSALLKSMPDLSLSVSYTTRPRSQHETEGKDYYFISAQEFERMQQQSMFIEYAKVFDHYYGTSRLWIEQSLAQHKNIFLEIDWQGAQQIRNNMPDSIGIFVLPPSLDHLQKRLIARQRDSTTEIQKRLKEAQLEITQSKNAHYIIINQSFDDALKQLQSIVNNDTDSMKLLPSVQLPKVQLLFNHAQQGT